MVRGCAKAGKLLPEVSQQHFDGARTPSLTASRRSFCTALAAKASSSSPSVASTQGQVRAECSSALRYLLVSVQPPDFSSGGSGF